MPKKSTRKITLESNDKLTVFFVNNANNNIFKEIEKKFKVSIKINHVGMLVLKGEKDISEKIFNILVELNKIDHDLTIQDIKDYVIDGKVINNGGDGKNDKNDWMEIEFRHRDGNIFKIKPKTKNQELFIQEILEKKIVFGLGSAGTGKSFLSICVALKMLEKDMIKKIIITRPTVEAGGSSIGYLPGSALEKIEPHLIATMNTLNEIIGKEKTQKYLKEGKIEILPLGFARGLTIGTRDAVFFLSDESQNMNWLEHKMILTRLGSHPNSRMVITGDQKQSDLKNQKDTLSIMNNILKPSKFVGSVIFQRADIVRSEVVRDILERIETWEDLENEKSIKKNIK